MRVKTDCGYYSTGHWHYMAVFTQCKLGAIWWIYTQNTHKNVRVKSYTNNYTQRIINYMQDACVPLLLVLGATLIHSI